MWWTSGFPDPTEPLLNRKIDFLPFNMKRNFLLISCLFLFLTGWSDLQAQVFTEPLRINPAQRDRYVFGEEAIAKRGFLEKSTGSDTIGIPFFDDFSGKDLSWAPSRNYFGTPIRTLRFTDSKNARGFGGRGLNIRTTTRGSVWENIGTDTTEYLSASFPEPNKIWACGKNGWLARSSDNGVTWNLINSPSTDNQSLLAIDFLSFDKGVLVDLSGAIYSTANGGQVWTKATWADTNFIATSVAWVNASRVVAVGKSGKTAISEDGGLSFTITPNLFLRYRNFTKVRFADGFFGLAVGDSGTIIKTLNGGLSWSITNALGIQTLRDVDVNPANDKLVWAVGDAGTLLYSQNKGDGWNSMKSGISANLLCISLVNEFRGWIGTSDGKLLQVVIDPLRPYSKWWQPNSGVFINNTFTRSPITAGIATFDGLNNKGIPYSLIKNKNGPCDTLASVHLNLSGFTTPLYISFFYQPGTGQIQLIPDPEDSLVLQMKGRAGIWQSLWNAKGIVDSVLNSPFRYVSAIIPDSLKYDGARFRFINFGNQNGSFDIWHIDYVRLNSEQSPLDSLARDYALGKPFNRLMKDYSALPMEQFRHVLENNPEYFNDKIETDAVNLNPVVANIKGSFYLNRILPEETESLLKLSNDNIYNMFPFNKGIYRRPVGVNFSDVKSSFVTDKYTTFQYGIGLDNDALTNEYLSNDTLFGHFNASTVMAYDDGTAELVRGVGDNGSIGAVKYFLPVSDTLTDIQLFFARTPENLSQTISFALLVYERIDTATNFPGANDLPLVRKQFILPPTDSVNKMITFSLRDENSLTKRILPGNKDFYIGWQQGLIDNGNEVRVGCDINSSNPGTFFFKSGQSWRQWGFDKFPLMIRPVFGPEFVTSVKSAISKPQSPFFPNPARTEIRNLRDFTSFQIFNMMGQLIDSCPSGRAGEALPIHLPAGIYTLKWMETGGHPVSQRLVVE